MLVLEQGLEEGRMGDGVSLSSRLFNPFEMSRQSRHFKASGLNLIIIFDGKKFMFARTTLQIPTVSPIFRPDHERSSLFSVTFC